MSHGRTPLFRKLQQTVQQAHWLNRNPAKQALLFEARDAARVSRRDFVRLLGAAGLVTVAGGFVPPVHGKEPSRPNTGGHEAVAILGAGVAGLTAAYRLQQAGLPCEIFEASERVGGRILTKYDFNKDAMFCELGGELVDSDHEDLIGLAHELGLEIQELKGGDKGADLYFFGGRHFTDEQLIPHFQPFAKKLAADVDEIYDDQDNFTAAASRLDKMSLAQYLAEAGAGVEKWVLDLLRVAYVIEYGREADEQSALNLIVYLEPDTGNGFKIFGDSDESKRIKGGSSTLPGALRSSLEKKVRIHTGHRLVKAGQSASSLALDFATGSGTKTFKFERVICALPFTMVRLVDGLKSLGLSKAKQESIARLGYGDNSKIMYGFTERWWRRPELGLPATSNGSIFTDLRLQCTWESSRAQPGQSGILTNYLGGRAARRFGANQLEKFRADLAGIFPGIGDKFDGERVRMNWPTYEYTRGSYSCPLIGQYTTLLQAAPEPELGGRLIFAGEHTSGDFAGFMNGAVQSGNRAAKQILKARKV